MFPSWPRSWPLASRRPAALDSEAGTASADSPRGSLGRSCEELGLAAPEPIVKYFRSTARFDPAALNATERRSDGAPASSLSEESKMEGESSGGRPNEKNVKRSERPGAGGRAGRRRKG
ncbi:hypothetical protein KM043_010516 [Ampulex compressa]|nr:hypothetical protein KM043_010516 [Ampulex compressa]